MLAALGALTETVPRSASFLKRMGYDFRSKRRVMLRFGRKDLLFSASTPRVRLSQPVSGPVNCRIRGTWSPDSRFSYEKCDTQSFPVVCDSPSPGTSWRNRENPAPLRAHVYVSIRAHSLRLESRPGDPS